MNKSPLLLLLLKHFDEINGTIFENVFRALHQKSFVFDKRHEVYHNLKNLKLQGLRVLRYHQIPLLEPRPLRTDKNVTDR